MTKVKERNPAHQGHKPYTVGHGQSNLIALCLISLLDQTILGERFGQFALPNSTIFRQDWQVVEDVVGHYIYSTREPSKVLIPPSRLYS